MVHRFIIMFLEQIATSGVSIIFFGKIKGLGCRSVSDSDFHSFQSAGLVTSKVDHWLPNDLYTVIRNPATQYKLPCLLWFKYAFTFVVSGVKCKLLQYGYIWVQFLFCVEYQLFVAKYIYI